jgi:hypothetical protein
VEDVPFAENALGDQCLLRDGEVIRLYAETGSVERTGLGLAAFLAAALADPVDVLALQPLMQLHREGQTLAPGQLVNAYPPFCTEESRHGVSLRPVDAEEQRAFLAELCQQLKPVADGSRIEIDG